MDASMKLSSYLKVLHCGSLWVENKFRLQSSKINFKQMVKSQMKLFFKKMFYKPKFKKTCIARHFSFLSY